MSEEANPSRYEIVAIDERNHAILRRKTAGYGVKDVLESFMPNVGGIDNARFIVKALKARDDETRHAAEERERAFQEGLTKPHVFTRATPRVELCYCGKPTGDPIHISEEDENQI